MGISRLIRLETTMSDEELRAPFSLDVVNGFSETLYFLEGTKSEVYVYPLTVNHEWESSFGVQHNTGIKVTFDSDMMDETEGTLNATVGSFIKAVGGKGWMQHLDVPLVHWNPDAIRVDPKVHGVDTIVESLKKVGLAFEFADLWAEFNAE